MTASPGCSRALLALVVLACFPGCADEERLGRGVSAIVGGEKTAGDPAVVLAVSYPEDHQSFDTCTASLVAPKVLLLAAHCVDEKTHPGYTFGIFPGPDASMYTTANTLAPKLLAVKEVHAHPDYDRDAPFHADIAVAILVEPLSAAPLPIQRAKLDASIVGSPARIVGYGATVYGEYNAVKHEASTTIASLGEKDTFVVGDAEHRSCVGDSGGPAFVEIDGNETIVGVDSFAELKGCLEPAHYRRTDAYVDFLDAFVPPPEEPDAGTPEGGACEGAGGCPDEGGKTSPRESGGCATRPGSPTGWFMLAALLGVLRLPTRRRSLV